MITGIQVEGGWVIGFNRFITDGLDLKIQYFDDTLMFSAVNHITGKSISISYENKDIGYSFDYFMLYRHLGKWIWNYNGNSHIYKAIKTGDNLNEIT